jgi:hypothetical protein
VYKFACSRVPEVLSAALSNAGLSAADVDHLLLHQANIRIIEAVAHRLGIPMDKARAQRCLAGAGLLANWLWCLGLGLAGLRRLAGWLFGRPALAGWLAGWLNE